MSLFRLGRSGNLVSRITSASPAFSSSLTVPGSGGADWKLSLSSSSSAYKASPPVKQIEVKVPPQLQQFRNFSSDASSSSSPLSKEHFDKLVKNSKIVVFMKGVPDEPRCGFSNAVVQILRMHGVSTYDSHNVLADESIRQGIKDYTNWPTIPQIFINGEFVGGCDILIEMHKNGELIEQLAKVGIKSALVEQEEGGKK